MLKLNQRHKWIRKRTTENDVEVYGMPRTVYINLLPLTGDSDMVAMGTIYTEKLRFTVSAEQGKAYNIGDLIYENCPVFQNNNDAGNASYSISAILTTLNISRIECVRLI